MPTDHSNRALTRNDNQGRRIYTHPVTGEEFFSVTSILGAADKPALNKWKQRNIVDFALDNLDALSGMDRDAGHELLRSAAWGFGSAASLGTEVHERFEDLMNELKSRCLVDGAVSAAAQMPEWIFGHPAEPHIRFADTAFLELLDEFLIEPLEVEATVINREVGYCGSADLMACIKPRDRGDWITAVFDVKSGKNLYGSTALQCMAYARGEKILRSNGDEDPPLKFSAAFGLHVRPKSWALKPLRHDEVVWEAFKAHATLTDWQELERRAVGAPLNHAAIERQKSYRQGEM